MINLLNKDEYLEQIVEPLLVDIANRHLHLNCTPMAYRSLREIMQEKFIELEHSVFQKKIPTSCGEELSFLKVNFETTVWSVADMM